MHTYILEKVFYIFWIKKNITCGQGNFLVAFQVAVVEPPLQLYPLPPAPHLSEKGPLRRLLGQFVTRLSAEKVCKLHTEQSRIRGWGVLKYKGQHKYRCLVFRHFRNLVLHLRSISPPSQPLAVFPHAGGGRGPRGGVFHAPTHIDIDIHKMEQVRAINQKKIIKGKVLIVKQENGAFIFIYVKYWLPRGNAKVHFFVFSIFYFIFFYTFKKRKKKKEKRKK